MKRNERVIVYGLLAVLSVGTALSLLSGNSGAAWAAYAAQLEKLGPAEALVLAESDSPDKSMELRNRDGRLSWSDDAYDRAYSLALVHVGKPMFGLLMSEPYQEPLNELRDELTADGQDRDQELRALFDQLQGLDQNSPDFADLQRRFGQLRQQMQQWQNQAAQRMAKLESEMLLKAYDEVVAAVEVVAERRDIDIVLRFLPLELEEETEVVSPEQAQTVIRGRTALKYPDALDITNAVMEELALEVE